MLHAIASAVFGTVLLLAMYPLAIFVAYRIGRRKGRRGWPWGLALGWLGVIVVAVLADSETVERRTAEAVGRATQQHRQVLERAAALAAERGAANPALDLRWQLAQRSGLVAVRQAEPDAIEGR